MSKNYASVIVGTAKNHLGPYPVDKRITARCSGANSELYICVSALQAGNPACLARALIIGNTDVVFLPAGLIVVALPAGVGRVNMWATEI